MVINENQTDTMAKIDGTLFSVSLLKTFAGLFCIDMSIIWYTIIPRWIDDYWWWGSLSLFSCNFFLIIDCLMMWYNFQINNVFLWCSIIRWLFCKRKMSKWSKVLQNERFCNMTWHKKRTAIGSPFTDSIEIIMWLTVLPHWYKDSLCA